MTGIQPRAWPALQRLLLPLSTAEREVLGTSIASDGVIIPVLVLPDGRIIDGHHRWELSGGNAPIEVRDIPEDDGLELGITLNAARRQISPEQMRALREDLRQDRERRREKALGLRQEGKTQAEAAALVGVDRSAVALWEKASNVKIHIACHCEINQIPDLRLSIPRGAYDAIYERAQNGETQAQVAADYSITRQRVAQIVQVVEARQREPDPVTEDVPLPATRYRCIVIDPPWPMGKIVREVRPDQGRWLDYPVMSLDEIASLPIEELAVAAGCHVYLWVTHRFLPDGLRILEGWGVKYQCVMTWVKPTGFTPFSWMYNTEHVLFGRIGNLKLERLGLKLSLEAPVSRHSEKPAIFYERIRLASPGPRLDMFARRAHAGFDVWGNEVASG